VGRSRPRLVLLADAHHCYSNFATRTSMFGAGSNHAVSRKMHGISWRLIASLTSTA